MTKKKRPIFRVHNIHVEIFNTVINVILTDDFIQNYKDLNAWEEFCEPFDKEEDAVAFLEGASAVTSHLKKSQILCMVFHPNKFNAGQIAHESFHAVCFMFQDKGITFDHTLTTEEVYAYTLQFVVQKTSDFLFEN